MRCARKRYDKSMEFIDDLLAAVDRIFVLRRNPPDIGTLSHQGMKLTSPETVAYFDFASDFRQISTAATNAITAGLKAPAVRNSKLPQLFPEAFGPDCAVSVSWASQQMTPTGFIAIQIKDQSKAEAAVQEVLSVFLDQCERKSMEFVM
jgi:hypothetical protein